jgi:hypothetical protein
VTITPTVRDSVEAVGDGDHAGHERDPLSLQPAWIPGTIPTLVVRGDTLSQVRIKRAERREYIRTPLRMCPDRSPFLGRELRLLVKDVGQGSVKLADIMEERDSLDATQSALVEVSCLAEYESVYRDPANVGARLGVISIDRVEQRLESCRAQPLGSVAQLVLAKKEAACCCADREWEDVLHIYALRKKCTGYKGGLGRIAAPLEHPQNRSRELLALQLLGSELFWWRSRSAYPISTHSCKQAWKDETCWIHATVTPV